MLMAIGALDSSPLAKSQLVERLAAAEHEGFLSGFNHGSFAATAPNCSRRRAQ
jgi:hypothetical protein